MTQPVAKDDLYSQDLTNASWRKSSFSQPDNCVEVSLLDGGVALRDSKNPQLGALCFDNAEFRAFVRGSAAGEFS
ncbi:MAG: DUF397 domain-containing protein [Streptosporangiales bacterium]|nr:DUF397 domain-containing protein [Streptosporangiales bacterium]